jgi:hypothetical protein
MKLKFFELVEGDHFTVPMDDRVWIKRGEGFAVLREDEGACWSNVNNGTVVHTVNTTFDPFGAHRKAIYVPPMMSYDRLIVTVVGMYAGLPQLRSVKVGVRNPFPVDISSLKPCPQFEVGDRVRTTGVWSMNLFEILTVSSEDGRVTYGCSQCKIDEDGLVSGWHDGTATTLDEDLLVRVEFWRVFGLNGVAQTRWYRGLWAKSAKEAEDQCTKEYSELDVAAVVRIDGSIVEQH